MVGLNIRNRDSLPVAFTCPHCSLLLRDPVQLIDCGHRMCQSCVDEQQGDVVVCAACRQRTPRAEVKLDRGFRNEFQREVVICAFCDWTDALKKYPDHLQQLHPTPSCVYCAGKFLSVDALNRHQQYDCQSITINCPLKPFGCLGIILRAKLNEHFRSEDHQLIVLDIIYRWKCITQTADGTTFADTFRKNAERHASQLSEAMDMGNALSDTLTVLTEDLRRLSTESVQHQTGAHRLPADITAMRSSIQEQNVRLDGMVLSQEATQHNLESIQGMIPHLSNAYDGTFLWKIDDVSTKIADAQTEKQTFIDSPAFYTSATGYKMCLRLGMNGDGNARGTHLSLHFVLMRGNYDAILKYPFLFKIILCLYDQTEQKNHLIETLRPDPASSSFQRPAADMNPPSGLSKFAPLVRIFQQNSPYVRENAMFIKAMVDFNDTSRALLPYALSLNPGLTTSMHQAMIQQKVAQQE